MGYSEEAKAAGRAAYKKCRAAGGSITQAKAAYARATAKAEPEYKKNEDRYQSQTDKGRARCAKAWRTYRARRRGHVPPSPGGPSLKDLVLAQGGICAICARDFAGVKPVLDHCHSTGKVRGALCDKCNLGLGLFYDSVPALMTAASYIIQNKVNA